MPSVSSTFEFTAELSWDHWEITDHGDIHAEVATLPEVGIPARLAGWECRDVPKWQKPVSTSGQHPARKATVPPRWWSWLVLSQALFSDLWEDALTGGHQKAQIFEFMSTLTRYLLREIMTILIVATTIIILVMIAVATGRELWEYSLPLEFGLKLFPFLLPDALRVALPVGLLLAVVISLGRLAGFNELLAIKAAGISPEVVLAPVFALAFLLSLFSVWMNDLAASWGRQGIQRVVLSGAEEIIYTLLKTRRAFHQGRVSIQVRGVEGRTLIEPLVLLQSSKPHGSVVITAKEAELLGDPASGTLRLRLRNGTAEMGDRLRVEFPDEYEQEIRLWDKVEGYRRRWPSQLALREIPEELVRSRQELLACWQKLTGLTPASGSSAGNTLQEQAEALRRELQQELDRWYRLRTEPYRRWAAGFSCFCFALVGSGMALRLRQREVLTAFFMCFAPILLGYYPLLAWTVDAAKSGWLPPWGVWTGNLLLVVWGGVLLWQEFRH